MALNPDNEFVLDLLPFEWSETCPKCGRGQHGAPIYVKESPYYVSPSRTEMWPEHLRISCACGYSWATRTADYGTPLRARDGE